MLGQNDNDQEEQVSQSLSDSSAGQQLPKSQADIYVMPEKFHPGKKNSSDNKMLMIAISVFLLVLVVVGGYFGYEQYKSANSQKVAVDQNPVVTQSDVTNQEPAIVTSTDTSLPEVTSTEASTTVTSTDSGLATTTATSTGNVVVDANMPPATTADADNDGLTDSEEGVIGARFDNPDSDGDSHPDGTEITNGYDPLSKGRLVDASFVQKITSNFSSDNFQTLSIKGWNFNNITSAKQIIITTNTGEIIRISVLANPDKISATNWYLLKNPGASLSQLRPVAAGNLVGVFAPNGLSAYISDESNGKIYSFEYILGTDNIFRYPALFAMMVRNFQLVSVATAQGASAQSTLKPATSTQSSKIVPTSTIENPAEQNNDATSTNPVS